MSIEFLALFEGYQPRRLQTAIRVIHFPISSLFQQRKPIMTIIPPFHWTQSLRCSFISRFRTLFRLFHSPTTATRACLTRRCFFSFCRFRILTQLIPVRSIAPLSLPSDPLSVQLDFNEESSSLMLEYSDWRNCSPFCNECVIKKTSETNF